MNDLKLSVGNGSSSSSSPGPASPASSDGTVPQVSYRRHSRKRSSQVLIPPIQPRRRSSSEYGDEGASVDDDDNEDGYFDTKGVYVDTKIRRKSAVTGDAFASGATSLIAGQMAVKMMTFVVNQALLTLVDPTLFGANAQLELLINTCLFFSREAVRLAAQRQTLNGKTSDTYRFEGGVVEGTISGTIQLVINIGYVPLICGVPITIALSSLYYIYNNPGFGMIPVGLFAVASIVELIGEPCFVLAQLQFDFKQRAKFESVATAARCLLTFVLIVFANKVNKTASPQESGIIAFAVGQLAYSTCLTAFYIAYGISQSRLKQYKLVMQKVWKDDERSSEGAVVQTLTYKHWFDQSTKQLAVSMWAQTVFKHVLSEGDKLLVGTLLSIKDQGVYAVVLNYGSLVARLLFLPVEEMLRSMFSKLLSDASTQSNLDTSVVFLSTVLRLYNYLSLVAVIFGPICAPYLLQLLAGRVWSATDAPQVLAIYTTFVPFLALNGALEAFVQSVASLDDIKRQGVVMVGFSVWYAAAAVALMKFMHLGARGLVIANMLNMAMRIVWCANFITAYYRKHGMGGQDARKWIVASVPPKLVWAVCAAVSAVLATLQVQVTDLSQLVLCGILALIVVASMAYCEPELLQQGVQKVLKQRRPSQSQTSKLAAVGPTTETIPEHVQEEEDVKSK